MGQGAGAGELTGVGAFAGAGVGAELEYRNYTNLEKWWRLEADCKGQVSLDKRSRVYRKG